MELRAGTTRVLARVAAGLWLSVGAAGCTLTELPEGSGADGGGAWLGYFQGDDLQSSCEAGAPDRLRLITRAGRGADFQAVEMIGNPAGGALLVHHRVGPADLAYARLPESWRKREQQMMLSPREFAAVVYWLDRLGMLSPGVGTRAGPDGDLEWLISGCLDGSWFQNSWQPAGTGDGAGIEIRQDRRAAAASPGALVRSLLNDPVPAPPRPETGNLSVSPSAPPAAIPMANRAGPGTGR
jgi:hypothetical protein